MAVLVLYPVEAKELIRDRRRRGIDRYDEVWDGVYVMSPLANNEHQEISTGLSSALLQAIPGRGAGLVYAGLNVSDRPELWRKNYRCPDVAVVLSGNPATNKGTYLFGGPDLAVEVLSPNDRSRKKLEFYANIGVRELLLVDRKPWSQEFYRLLNGQLQLVGKLLPGDSGHLASMVLSSHSDSSRTTPDRRSR